MDNFVIVVFIVVIVFIFFSFGSMIFFLVYFLFIRKGPGKEKLASEAETYLKSYEKKIKPFTGLEKLTDYARRYVKRNGFNGEKMKALLVDENGQPVVAFAWRDYGPIYTEGQLYAKTSEKTLYMDYNSSGVKISVDGTYAFHFSFGTNRVRDAVSNDTIAAYKRNDGTVSSFNIDVFGFEFEFFEKNTNKHHQVFFKDGHYAEITNPATPDNRILAVSNIDGDLTEDQKNLLLALVIFEVAQVCH